jgi:competence protein ComGC
MRKAQATLEFMLFFIILLAVIAVIMPSLIGAYEKMSSKSSAAMARASIENEILAYEIACNGGWYAPSEVIYSSGMPKKIENWRIIVNGSEPFSGIFEGCFNNAFDRSA